MVPSLALRLELTSICTCPAAWCAAIRSSIPREGTMAGERPQLEEQNILRRPGNRMDARDARFRMVHPRAKLGELNLPCIEVSVHRAYVAFAYNGPRPAFILLRDPGPFEYRRSKPWQKRRDQSKRTGC